MNDEKFQALAALVLDSKDPPPASLFSAGYGDWHARARLGHFLALPSYHDQRDDAKELLRSVENIVPDGDNAEDVEEKVFALQKLAALLKDDEDYKDALHYINRSIELAEGTDFLYKFILRGELWADRWNILALAGRGGDAEAEADERLEAYADIPIPRNSYMYYGYRFKAQLAARRGDSLLVVKDYLHMALKYIAIPEENQALLEIALAQSHDNTAWLLTAVDKATPNPNMVPWDI